MTIEKRSAMLSRRKYLLPFVIVLFLLLTGCVGETVEAEKATEVDVENRTYETVEKNDVESEETKDETQESSFDYNDFVGYYLHFDSNDRAQSDMIVTIGNKYLTLGWYLSELELYEILDWSIADNVLTIDYYLHPYPEGEGDYGTLSVSLLEENGEKYIDFGLEMPFFEATYDEVIDYNYSLQDYLIEDVSQ